MSVPGSTTDRWWVREWDEMRSAKGWWHSFELPDGTRIDGVHSIEVLKNRIAQFPIPEDLRGQRVLDIGTWDGWYSFEMERRGAEVMAIDNWDNPRFRQIHSILGSHVEYRRMDMFELTPERVGRFDIVLFMGVLYHLKHPLLALEHVCRLTTRMAAVESFILRDSPGSGEKIEPRPFMEFYETDEFGGQTDNWVGPSLPCLMAFCRTAGFARVELRGIMDYGVSVACYRHWEPPSSNGFGPPRLTRVQHNTREGVTFSSASDEYVTAWFTCGEENLGLDDVQPEVSRYGVRPIYVAQLEDGAWQTNFKLPPGLETGWHEVTIRLLNGPPSNSRRIAVDSPEERLPAISVAPPREAGTLEPKPMNVQQVVSGIHARVRREGNHDALSFPDSSPSSANPSPPHSSPSSQDSYELTALRSAYQRLYQNRDAVGKTPPSPNTIRARFGGYLVRGVQRCLFWYTPQILQFQNDAINALNSLCNLVGSQSERTTSLSRQVQKLRREILDSTTELVNRHAAKTTAVEHEVQRLRRELSDANDLVARQSERAGALEHELQKLRRDISNLKVDLTRPTAGNIEAELPGSFQFALQDRFRGSETETGGKLQAYLENLKPLLPALPHAPWIDVGCGRGEWLEAVSKLGYRILGLDSNPASVLRCREKNLHAEQADALAYLRSLGESSTAVVSAFHVAEHWTMPYLLDLIQEVVRILQPGGLLIVETPNPANLLVGSTNFWNDPTHCRPIPVKLLEFMYEYCDLSVVKRLELNPLPNDHRFAFDEISVVHRLNDYFYGPQDYGLIGRR